ncbi:MAG: hypothetical protein ABW133_14885 [Polyangiaceae bacterium]
MTALLHTLFPHETAPAKIKGEVRFVAADERSQTHGTLGLLLTVRVAPPARWEGAEKGQGGRQRLRDVIESAIESALEMNDAPPPGVGGLGDLDQCLSDQLYRARSIGAGGLAIFLPDLTSAASLSGALDAEDSAVLRWWIAATTERPVMLMVDTANRRLGAYGPPAPLEQWVDQRGTDGAHKSARISVNGVVKTNGTRDDETPRQVAIAPQHEKTVESAPAERDDARKTIPDADEVAPKAAFAEPTLVSAAPAAEPKDEAREDTLEEDEIETPRERQPAASHVEISGLRSLDGERVLHIEADLTYAVEQPLPTTAPSADTVVPLFPRRESPFRKPTASGFAVGGGPIDWRGFANDLALARGPKPLTFVERLFMTRYMPLLEAIARGEADDTARRTAEQWADDFARSYTEGFAALRVTGKRPRMVLDAPQLASQVARLHGAKSTHLVLIDAMRFDLGVRVHDRMCDALTSQATCTERLLLWSALPTTTPMQLDLLAHGPDGLAHRGPPSEQEEPGIRGRAAPVLRRIKVGGRDVLKLDLVQSRLHEAGPPLGERLDNLADEVSAIVAAHARNLPPRSLMLVFGDHGFRMESSHHGTSAGSSGGARPEEVLVPGFAWLVGDVH